MITTHASPKRTDRQRNIIAIVPRIVLTNAISEGGSAPDPVGKAYRAPTDPVVRYKGRKGIS